MKRFISLLIAFCLTVLVIAGCSSGETVNEAGQSSTSSTVSYGTNVSLPADNPVEPVQENTSVKTEYHIGETWTVEGLWTVTVESIEETQDRNPYAESNPAAVYLVTYTYTNIGYEEAGWDGLFLCFDQIVDSTGFMGYDYPGDTVYYAQEVPVGATCRAQACIGVDNAGLPIKASIVKYDTNEVKHSATFIFD